MQNDPVFTHAASEYLTPAVRIIPIFTEEFICESPLPGGNEGIGYENWN